MKLCISCRVEKPYSDFHRYGTQKDGYHYYCKSCRKTIENTQSRRDYAKRYAALRLDADSQYGQHSRRRARYGILPDEYLTMYEQQNGLCAICNNPERATYKGRIRSLAVDHDHATGKIRSLLCNSCNNGLGRFLDKPALLRAAADYLEKHGC